MPHPDLACILALVIPSPAQWFGPQAFVPRARAVVAGILKIGICPPWNRLQVKPLWGRPKTGSSSRPHPNCVLPTGWAVETHFRVGLGSACFRVPLFLCCVVFPGPDGSAARRRSPHTLSHRTGYPNFYFEILSGKFSA